MFRKVPLIVILGSTGTGKTKLSIELAERFKGEIISADSMQLYKNLNIATAKATKEEQAMAKHHLLDIAHPDKPFTVVDFRDAALPIVENLLKQSKCPIVVGGTNYYIESLLWNVLVNPPLTDPGKRRLSSDGNTSSSKKPLLQESESETDDDQESISPAENQTVLKNLTYEEIVDFDTNRLHQLLTEADPTTAQRLHPNNRRKILRALEVFLKIGTTLSDIIKEQRDAPGGSRLGGPLRYEHILLFWLRCNQDVLNARLDKRINNMILDGLLEEIRTFHDSLAVSQAPKDYTKGILQTIGFKEFIPYLDEYDQSQDNLITEYIKNDCRTAKPNGFDLLQKCLEELRIATKRYSKKQIKWVKHRFLGCTNRTMPLLYALDTSNPENWTKDVYEPAVDVVQSYISNCQPNLKPLEPIANPRANLNEDVTNFCTICQRHFIGEYQWNIHRKSNKHKKMLQKHHKQIKSEECVSWNENKKLKSIPKI